MLFVTDKQLVKSCGLDALIFLRTLLLAVQFLLPTSFFVCIIRTPACLSGRAPITTTLYSAANPLLLRRQRQRSS